MGTWPQRGVHFVFAPVAGGEGNDQIWNLIAGRREPFGQPGILLKFLSDFALSTTTNKARVR